MILHIMTRQEWDIIKESVKYTPKSIQTDGFIHCCTKEQIANVANQFFSGQTNLVLLRIDPDKVTSTIVFEDLQKLGQLFPHIYGPLNLNAVMNVIQFKPNIDGKFAVPNESLYS
ncbi:DUF952 domain-containing protein [Bacillus spongiae]|uniref:DUF952 domain-containing protein n=1 Tax=Bacillus spongiae TaxID=2683610 RepID=A0ABU8HCU1_9BACI